MYPCIYAELLYIKKNLKKIKKYSSHWLETVGVATFPAIKITDCVHSRDNSSQRVPSGIVLNALSVTKQFH